MKRIYCRKEQLSREKLSNPNNVSHRERLIKAGAVDLTNNHIIIDLGNGYIRIEPIDKSKKVK